MASPTVEHRGIGTQGGSPQTYTIPGGAMSAGELLVVVLGNAAGTESAMAFDTGWGSSTQVNQSNDAGIILGWYRSSSGGETTFDITSDGAAPETFATMYVLSGAEDPATQAPDTGGGATGASDSRDPPSVSVTGGPKDVLVIAGWAQEAGANGGQPTTPTNYTNALYSEASAQPDAGGSAERALNTSSEDPGAFTGGTNDNWAADTIAIHPASVTAIELSASPINSVASSSATLDQTYQLDAQVQAIASLAGSISQTYGLEASSTATASISGSLVQVHGLVALSGSVASNSVALDQLHRLNADPASSVVFLAASLAQVYYLDASVSAVSSLDTALLELVAGTSLYATGDSTITDVVNEADATTNLYLSVDDDPASPTDADWVNNAVDVT